MHHQSLPLTIGGNVLKECDDLDILGVSFFSEKTFEINIRSVSRGALQRLGIFGPSLFSTVRCSGAGKQFDRVVSCAIFFLMGVCLSVTLHIVEQLYIVLYMLIKLGVRCTLSMVLCQGSL